MSLLTMCTKPAGKDWIWEKGEGNGRGIRNSDFRMRNAESRLFYSAFQIPNPEFRILFVMIQRLRVPLGFVIGAAVLYLATPTGFSIAIGLPIAIVGAAFRSLAAGTIRKDAQLATTGPYAWTRNPLYFGSLLLTLGFAVMSWNPIAAMLLLAPSAFIYPVVIRNEEAHLSRLFPEQFPLYRSKVPAFVPRFRSSDFRFSLRQYMANREYNTVLGFSAALAVLVAKWLR